MKDLRERLGLQGNWGLLRTDRDISYIPEGMRSSDKEPVVLSHWINAVTTQDSQGRVACCVNAGTGNDLELKSRMILGKEWLGNRQVDMFRLHKMTRQRFYGDESLDDGTELFMAAKLYIEMGLYPPDTKIVEVEPELPSIALALRTGGLIQGLAISDGWNMEDKENGCIREGFSPMMFALHCTYLVGLTNISGKYYVLFVNSWIPWGQHGKGLGMMSWGEWYNEWRWCGSKPLSIQMPDEFDVEAWKKAIEPFLVTR